MTENFLTAVKINKLQKLQIISNQFYFYSGFHARVYISHDSNVVKTDN